jgi:hypothetical protein
MDLISLRQGSRVAHPLQSYRKGWVIERSETAFNPPRLILLQSPPAEEYAINHPPIVLSPRIHQPPVPQLQDPVTPLRKLKIMRHQHTRQPMRPM